MRVTFTDDAGSSESLTSTATAAVAPKPLTASVHNTPQSHDGQSVFTFELRFSETPKTIFSYVTLMDHAFTVTGGERRGGESEAAGAWKQHWMGDKREARLLRRRDHCAAGHHGLCAQRAVCTEDARMLSRKVELTVGGTGT